jgi:RNA polymerase sigma factor (sigma-70 family)
MATSQVHEVLQYLRRAVRPPDGAAMTDGQLLSRFVEGRDEAAFAALVRRHGPMVWGVCRRLLANHQDAEDAFQATFLVLVRKAATVLPREMVANWLYGVACMTARRSKVAAARARRRERQVANVPEPAAAGPDLWDDLRPLLDQELARLPDRYRVVVVLCDLEGKTRKEAAGQLGLPEGTVASRLARARAMLAKRLARHGLGVSGGALAAVLSQKAASAGVPSSAVSSTINAASVLAAGRAAVGIISARVAGLTDGVLKAMLLTKLKIATAVLLVAVAVAGSGGLLYRTQAAQAGTQPVAPPTVAERNARAGKKLKADKDLEALKLLVAEARAEVEVAVARLRTAEARLRLLQQAYEAAKTANGKGEGATPKDARPAPQEGGEEDDVADVHSEDLRAGKDENKRYFLIGPAKGARRPKAGYGLIVVLPGGPGSADFHPFVKRIYKYAIPPGYLVAQPVAVKWTNDQAIVWPTRKNPAANMKFSTEEFVAAVIREVAARHKVNPKRAFTLSWSSSGPAAYAISLTDRRVTGSFIAMSVFNPRLLPPLDKAKGRAYYLYHSPQDRVCPYRMAQQAAKDLQANHARVKLVTYEGGHGWRAGLYQHIRRGVEWLEENGAPPAKKEDQKGKEREGFTAWGKQVGGLQAGLGFRPGEPRVYHTHVFGRATLAVRVRNVGKKEVKFQYCPEFVWQELPTVTDARGKPIALEGGLLALAGTSKEASLAPGKSMELYQLELHLLPERERIKPTFPTTPYLTLYGPGKFIIQYKQVAGDWSMLKPPTLSKLATGKLELQVDP